MPKNRKRVIALAIIVIAICAVVLARAVSSPRRTVERVFKQNETVLNEMVQKYLEGDTDALKTVVPGVEDADYWHGEHAMIEFFVKGRGIAPASTYFGFYYSVDGVPLAFQNTKMTLVESGDGWEWTHGGDNRGYTEHITGNWYYYEASF